MGMFDEVSIRCPHCGGITIEQTKAGVCLLRTYGQDEVPPEIARDLDGTRYWCEHCNGIFKIVSEEIKTVRLRGTIDD